MRSRFASSTCVCAAVDHAALVVGVVGFLGLARGAQCVGVRSWAVVIVSALAVRASGAIDLASGACGHVRALLRARWSFQTGGQQSQINGWHPGCVLLRAMSSLAAHTDASRMAGQRRG